jgi:hypothetical protein
MTRSPRPFSANSIGSGPHLWTARTESSMRPLREGVAAGGLPPTGYWSTPTSGATERRGRRHGDGTTKFGARKRTYTAEEGYGRPKRRPAAILQGRAPGT